jgi:uracil-DNA glycosylase family 4
VLNENQQHCLRGIGIRQPPRAHSAASNIVAEVGIPTIAPVKTEPLIPATVIRHIDPVITNPDPVPTAGPVVLNLGSWDDINQSIQSCSACALAQNCTQKVPGTGSKTADLMIIGEGPGHDEDIRGEPFVGRSGQLLEKLLASIGLDRDSVFMTNIVKCQPPNNRDPKPEEIAQCGQFLEAQIKSISPAIILSVGRISAHSLLGTTQPIGRLLNDMHQLPGSEIPLKVTYHPAYLLRNPAAKSLAWHDMKMLYAHLKQLIDSASS